MLFFVLAPLPYDYAALEPHIDARTVEIHYTKHHQGYVDKLNDALKSAPEWQNVPLEQLLVSLDKLPASIRVAVRNNGGGHFAHTLYWQCMKKNGGGKPQNEVADAINRSFGSFDAFKEQFTKAASAFFGSGWVWLCLKADGSLTILATPGHDVPMQQGLQPLLVIDVWEHAYYLKYQNRRPEYIANWWDLVNWNFVHTQYTQMLKKVKP